MDQDRQHHAEKVTVTAIAITTPVYFCTRADVKSGVLDAATSAPAIVTASPRSGRRRGTAVHELYALFAAGRLQRQVAGSDRAARRDRSQQLKVLSVK